MTEKAEPYYQREAKRLVDMLFDEGLFKEAVSRDQMNIVEDLIAYYLQSGAESAKKCALLVQSLKK